MDLKIVPESRMEPGLDAEIRRGLCVCFPADAAVFSHTREWHGSGPAFSVVLEQGGGVVAHVGVVDRLVDVDGTPARAAGVQNVYVLPEHRRKGYVDQVMMAAMEEAHRQGYDCGLLFCLQDLVKVYARSGWRLAEQTDVICVGQDGRDEGLPPKNVTLWYPLAWPEMNARRIHLQGADW